MSPYVLVSKESVFQIVNQETGIALPNITDDTKFGLAGGQVAAMCSRRFGRTISVACDNVGELCRHLGL